MMQAKLNQVIQVVRRFSLDHWGASEQVAWQTAKRLRQNGTPSSIFSTCALSQPGKETYKQIPIERFNYFYPQIAMSHAKSRQLDLKGGNPYAIGLLKAIWQSPCKLIHCHTRSRLAAEVRLLSRVKNIPYVVTLQGDTFQLPKSEKNGLERLARGFGRYGYFLDQAFKPQLVLDQASGVICPNYDEFTEARKTYPHKPCLYLPGGVDQQRFITRSNIDVRAKHKIGRDKFVLLCSGRIDSQKNQLVLLELMGELVKHRQTDFHLVLMGHLSNKQYFEDIKQRVNAFNLESRVTLICGLHSESEELAAIYQQADALVIPSIHEPMGLPVLEAWISRLPVLAAKTGALCHLIDNGQNGILFNPYCKRSLGEALQTLITQPGLCHQIVSNGYKKVTQQFLWQHYIDKLMTFYEEIEIFHSNQTASQLIC